MAETPRNRIRIPEHVVFRSFAEETVVLNLRSGNYHGLNATGGRMLELLRELGEPEAVAERVAAETGAPQGRVSADLLELCSSLEERGLIELDPPA